MKGLDRKGGKTKAGESSKSNWYNIVKVLHPFGLRAALEKVTIV
jgi:hypothetical protein